MLFKGHLQNELKPEIYEKTEKGISAQMMGILALGSAHARLSARPPINMSGNYSRHVSAKSP